MPSKTFDIAIVGGGISGLYAAWRLRGEWQHSEVSRKELAEKLGRKPEGTLEVIILEQDSIRLGGRLRSTELPFPGGSVIAEVGAMRFTTRHKLLRDLLHELHIRTVPFEGPGFSTRYYLRGKHFSVADIERNDTENFPYHLKNTEQCQSPTALLSHVLECTLRELSLDDDATPETLRVLEKLRGKLSRDELKHYEWEQIREHGLLTGRVRLKNIGMWNLIHHYLSPDAAHFVEDGFGYESIIGNWNVSDAIPWFISDFNPAQTYESIVGSFSRVVEELKKEITNGKAEKEGPAFNCNVVMGRRLKSVSVHKNPDNQTGSATSQAELLLLGTEKTDPEYKHKYEGSTADIFWDEDGKGKEHIVRARLAILALPKWPLEQLDFKGLGLSDHDTKVWNARLEAVRPHRLVKIAQGYRHAWWRKGDSPKGAGRRVFTDLPLRQVYYFDREWLEERGRYQYYEGGELITDAHGRKPEIEGIAVAYLDGHYASFWRFITAVQRIHDLEDNNEPLLTMKNEDRVCRIEEREKQKREWFGSRVWGWVLPKGELAQLCEKYVDEWLPEERARHLYFYRHGLYERASTKMAHILAELHSSHKHPEVRAEVPVPVAGAYTFWENFGERFEAGWHTWEPGVDSTAAMKSMVQPFDGRNIYVCGEAYSSEQGWIEGALKSVEMVMDRLGIMLPGEEAGSDEIRDYVCLGPRPDSSIHPPETLLSPYVSIPLSTKQSLVFISGQIGFNTQPLPEKFPSFEEQAVEALKRLRRKMEESGESSKFVVVRVFLQSMECYGKFNQIYREELGKGWQANPPARTAVAVKALPFGALVEVDAIAIVKTPASAGS